MFTLASTTQRVMNHLSHTRPVALISPRRPRDFLVFSPGSPFRHYASSPSVSPDQDHYANLGVATSATRKQIRDKFYELSRKYHPDAPSTSSMTPEERTTRFQQLSQSYSVLSDPNSRKTYDLTRGGGGGPGPGGGGQVHRRSRHHAGYTRGSGGMGYSQGPYYSATSDNDERRRTANYAWHHPQRGRSGTTSSSSSSTDSTSSRPDPFSHRTPRGDDHLASFAKRARRRHEQTMGKMKTGTSPTTSGGFGSADGHYKAGTAVFGRAKAEEESRLINDSSTLRSSQVLFVFGSVFVVAWLFSGGHDRHEQSMTTRRRNV